MNWQDTITLGIVAAAAVYLARRAWQTLFSKRSGGCGSCGACAENGAGEQQPLVQIGSKD